MQPNLSLQSLQKPATCPYPEPHKSISCPSFCFFIALLIPFSHLCLGLPSALFHSGFATKSLYVLLVFLMCATNPAQITLLYLMNLTLVGWGAQIRKPLLPCKFLHPTVKFFLFDPTLAPFLEKKVSPFSSLNPMKTKINVHYMSVWLLITKISFLGYYSLERAYCNRSESRVQSTYEIITEWWNPHACSKTCPMTTLSTLYIDKPGFNLGLCTQKLESNYGVFFFAYSLSVPPVQASYFTMHSCGVLLSHYWHSLMCVNMLGEASVYFYPILPSLMRIGNIQMHIFVHMNTDRKFDVNI